MRTASSSGHASSPPGGSGARVVALADALEFAAHVLPAQGPIGIFVHHNTLHAFQQRAFHDAVAEAATLWDAEPYLAEREYHAAYRAGRIDDRDLDAALARRRALVPDRPVGPLRLSALESFVLRAGASDDSPVALRWAREELELARRFRQGVEPGARSAILTRSERFLAEAERAPQNAPELAAALRLRARGDDEGAALEASFAVCARLARRSGPPASERLLARLCVDRTPRDLLVAAGAEDPSEASNAILVHFLAAYLDEGMARWPMPNRSEGLLRCFLATRGGAASGQSGWLGDAVASLESMQRAGLGPEEALVSLLDDLGVDEAHWGRFLARAHGALPGWAGMIARLEHHPEDRSADAPPASLLELSVLRLALDRASVHATMRELGLDGRPRMLAEALRRAELLAHLDRADGTVDRLHHLTQLAGLAAPDLVVAGEGGVAELVEALEAFDSFARRRVWHEAYERHHTTEIVGAVAKTLERGLPEDPESPTLQAIFCIDDREESIRRHLEELEPRTVSYGAAGFFGVAMRFTSLDDPSSRDLCPVVVKPAHAVCEVPATTAAYAAELRQRRRALIALAAHELSDGSRSFVRGIAVTSLLGLLALLPLTLQLASPRLAARLLGWVSDKLLPSPETTLTLTRDADAGQAEGLAEGFTLDEQADRVEALLRNIGLTSGFAPIVLVVGHGASTANNPHHSAYECGACGGSSGGASARAFARMANDPEVRSRLAARGIHLGEGTWFVGSLHDTTSDAIDCFELDRAPDTHREALAALEPLLRRAREASAHERCRRFEHAPLTLTPAQALAHVEGRAVDLSQARPELGHATNAIAVVGRRALTRGLFLDRRSFLVSYDPRGDEGLVILERILRAVLPVGAGINLEYYFSRVDPARYGAGTKLPHNVVDLLGVMEGTSGDLRTGLPTQMIEIHEPVRLLCIVEASPEALLEIAGRVPEVAELAVGGWVRLVSVDPEGRRFSELGDGRFVPLEALDASVPRRARSVDWYGGRREPLGPALLGGAQEEAA